jgi:hypothetical protein
MAGSSSASSIVSPTTGSMTSESGRGGRGRPPPGVLGVLGRNIERGKWSVAGDGLRRREEVLETVVLGAPRDSVAPRE